MLATFVFAVSGIWPDAQLSRGYVGNEKRNEILADKIARASGDRTNGGAELTMCAISVYESRVTSGNGQRAPITVRVKWCDVIGTV